ncbi:MAG: hypothetical protein R6V73_02560 [Anaerolineales bacterium]|jgi:hypothetical protein
MLGNGFLTEEGLLTAYHKDLLRAAEQERLAKSSARRKKYPLRAQVLVRLGDCLVHLGTWLQKRFGTMLDFNAFEAEKHLQSK